MRHLISKVSSFIPVIPNICAAVEIFRPNNNLTKRQKHALNVISPTTNKTFILLVMHESFQAHISYVCVHGHNLCFVPRLLGGCSNKPRESQ